jgi:hypothetical protein
VAAKSGCETAARLRRASKKGCMTVNLHWKAILWAALMVARRGLRDRYAVLDPKLETLEGY